MKLFAAALLLLLFLASCGTIQEPGLEGAGRDEPTNFSFTTFEGNEFSAAERRGTPVVLNFWESW
jgi:cytochrome oxidase Cu insertion factor (SCO1/SenC/PrrC family)